jgi:hypothetical protein
LERSKLNITFIKKKLNEKQQMTNKAEQSRERRLKLKQIRDALAQNIDHPDAYLVEKYREQKRTQSQKYRMKQKLLMKNYIYFSEEDKVDYWDKYIKANDDAIKEKERHTKKYIATKETQASLVCLLDSFQWTDLDLFE